MQSTSLLGQVSHTQAPTNMFIPRTLYVLRGYNVCDNLVDLFCHRLRAASSNSYGTSILYSQNIKPWMYVSTSAFWSNIPLTVTQDLFCWRKLWWPMDTLLRSVHLPCTQKSLLILQHLADAVLNSLMKVPLKGIAIGNGWIDSKRQYPAYIDYAVKMGRMEENDAVSACEPTIAMDIVSLLLIELERNQKRNRLLRSCSGEAEG